MAANDYHVIVCLLLKYLYDCLKAGNAVDMAALEKLKERNCINEMYWKYIIRHLYQSGYVEGVGLVKLLGEDDVKLLPNFAITPKGIEYLKDDSQMQQAKDFILDALKASAPDIIKSFIS